MTKKQQIALLVLVVILVLGGACLGSYYYWQIMLRSADRPKVCTMEAKLCPDGSAVGRSGPNCEFTECPDTINPALAKIGSTITIQGVSITPLEVIEDSRCPVDVDCFWAGTVKLRARLENKDVTREEILEMGKSFNFAGAEVLLKSVNPSLKSKQTITPDQYNFDFFVTLDDTGLKTYKNDEYGFEYKYPGVNRAPTPWDNTRVKRPMLNVTRDKTAYNKNNCYVNEDADSYEYIEKFVVGDILFCVNKKIELDNSGNKLSLYYSTSKDGVYYTFLFYTDCFADFHAQGCIPFNENEGKKSADAIVSTFKFTN